MTAIDHFVVASAQAVRHGDTYERMIDNFIWLKKAFRFINIPTTKQALWDVLGRTENNLLYRFFCSKCKDEIGEGRAIRVRCACGRCGPNQQKSFVATFVQVLLRPQLSDILAIPNIAESLNYRNNRYRAHENAMEDIYDGQKYQELLGEGEFLSNNYNYSLTMWTDGLKLTKSSRATTYPVVLQLNELSPHARKKHL